MLDWVNGKFMRWIDCFRVFILFKNNSVFGLGVGVCIFGFIRSLVDLSWSDRC